METPFDFPEGHKSGYVALVGRPNVGKSTLMNALVGRKLSIVTNKPQTTRHRVLGISSEPDHQILFLDTPGVIEPRYRLQEVMMHYVDNAVSDADILLFMVDVSKEEPERISDDVLAKLGGQKAFLVLNKIDLVRQEDALPLVEAYGEQRVWEEIIPISATKGFNLDRLKALLLEHLPEGPPFYPKDMVSEHPERFFIAEIVREKIFQQFRQEIPYSTQVNVVAFGKRDDGKTMIDAEIVVERDTQKGIIIGKGGKALKRIGTAARHDIETFLDEPIYLQLHVKTRGDWRNKDHFLRSYGYRK